MDGRPVLFLAGVGAVVAVIFAATGVSPALSQDELPEDNSGLDQYIEGLPSVEGDRAPNRRSRRFRSLPAETRRALERSSEGKQLEELSSSSGLGAPAPSKPPTSPSKAGGRSGRGAAPTADKDADASAASAVGSTIFDHTGVAILAATLLGLTVAGALLGIRLRRSARE